MRSTLFFIPHQFAGVTLFGFGWILLLLVIGCASWIAWTVFSLRRMRAGGKEVDITAEILTGLPIWGVAAALVVFVLPNVEQVLPGTPPIILGLPIRGYGVMVLLGLLSGIGITIHRGKSLGISADFIIGLGFWMMLGGVLGARTFYVVQKWDEFSSLAFGERMVAIVKLTEGGLVIYGGVIGGIVAGCIYCVMHRQPVRAFGDLIAPAFLIGYSFGRIGCLLNGCCFGGVCTENLPTIQFPHGSGPYLVQLESGKLLGLELAARAVNRAGSEGRLPATVASVVPGSPAEQAGIKAGSTITKIRPFLVPYDRSADPAAPPRVIAEVTVDQSNVTFDAEQLPASSLPVHPSQIYAAVNAALLCWLIWCLQPWPRWDGMTFLVAILLYAVSRFLIEGIRSDEGGQLGTSLSIAQWISLSGAAVSIVLMLLLAKTTPSRAWEWRSTPVSSD